MRATTGWAGLLACGLAVLAAGAPAQTIKVGLLNSTSGPFASLGDQIDKSIKLYMKENAGKLPPGVKIELVIRDAGGHPMTPHQA